MQSIVRAKLHSMQSRASELAELAKQSKPEQDRAPEHAEQDNLGACKAE